MRTTRPLLILLAMAMVTGAAATGPVRAGDYRTISASLDSATPDWHQTYMDSGHPVGCGATAWGIVLGYWKQHKGMHRLLEDIQMPHPQTQPDAALARHLEEIADSMNSTYGTYQGKKWGRTTPSKMLDVTQ